MLILNNVGQIGAQQRNNQQQTGQESGPPGRWTIAFLVLVVFSCFLLWKLSVQEKRFDKTVEKLQKLQLDLQELQLEKEEIKQFLYETLSEYGGERGKSSEESPSQSSEFTINIAQVFGSFIKQMLKQELVNCIPGQSGRDGLPGLSGKDGLPGRDGRTGLPGPAGRTGEAGRNGEPGSKGSGGKQGPRGIAGRKGDMGMSREKGERGERGVGGLHGILGPRGEKGKEGDKGERGHTGFKGEKGGKGEIGLQGGKGMKGNKGDEQDLHQLFNLPSQCLPGNHRVLNETWRQTSEHVFETGSHCDQTGSSYNQHGFTPGWHSFSPTIGGAMPEKCPSLFCCGTAVSGWLKGSHPNLIGQKISRTVCFSNFDGCCWGEAGVEVINCGQYYIYNLPNTPACKLAYCARGQ